MENLNVDVNDQFAKEAMDAGMTVIDIPSTQPVVAAHKMNVGVVVGAAIGGTAFGLFLGWATPKVINHFRKKAAKKALVDKEADALLEAFDSDDDESFFDEN